MEMLAARRELDFGIRELAVRADESSHERVSLLEIWNKLARAECEIRDDFHTRARHYLVLSRADPSANFGPLHERHLALLRAVLLAGSQKQVAYALRVSSSTVATVAKQCLERFGLSCGSSRVPAILVQAAHASNSMDDSLGARSSRLTQHPSDYWIVSVERRDLHLLELFTPAVSDVLRLRVEGKSHAEIAELRRASRRTVANQLAAAFQRLRVSGRAELLVRMFAASYP